MVVVLFNCFHWMGYHCARQLLHSGHEVVGVDEIDDPMKEQLYMYVGRNSNFQHFNTIEERDNHSHYTNDESHLLISNETLVIKYKLFDEVTIDLPPLFGEWMDMKDKEIETIDDLKLWILERGALYVGDFFETVIDHVEKGEILRLAEKKFSLTERETQPQEVLERIWAVRHLNQ
ncbi:hypothetical protein GCM10010954_12700 [Halobacillus andaensis]|uniref:Uncharacterized protein n=1 Tax=Halobacillus andaensis TaxID=1176239 RepID=A0A917EWA6_HALAA|nr:hypothetical protein [Halobacillus andaensis]MBP2004066.1 hypothetical protein [Halobacillus andaensis]GGF15527.1 hypothetical protein GCM10010954_12700 [Halobacillus andaensis]